MSSPRPRVARPNGGAYAYRKGTAAEYAVMRHLEELGWYVIRAYASRGPWDLLAMHRDRAPLMVQVKATEQAYMLPEERAALITMADQAGAMPVACACPHPYSSTLEGLRYWVLEVGASRILMDP